MHKEDAEKLLIGSVVAVCIALYVLFTRVNALVNVKFLAIVILLLLNLVVVPQFIKLYYNYHNLQIGAVRFVPFYNYYLIFGKVVSVCLTITLVIALICFVGSLMPVKFFVSFMERRNALLMTRFLLHWAFVLVTVIEIEIGIGLCTLLTELNKELFDKMNVRVRKTDTLMYLALIIPLIRIFPLKVMSDRLSALLQRKMVKQKYKQKLKKEVKYYE